MPDFENAASWDDADPPTRGVWFDAEPDTRERGAQNSRGGPPPAPRGGYRIRSDETWARARDAYLAGETAEEVAFRFDLTVGTVRDRAAREGWRRVDQDDPDGSGYRSERGSSLLEPGERRLDDRWAYIDDDEGYAELAERALFQLRRAMAQERAGAAASWMRVHERLMARAERQAACQARAAETAQRAAADAARAAAAEALVAGRAEAAERDARLNACDDLMRDLAAVAERSAAVGLGDDVSRAAIDAELARLERVAADLGATTLAATACGAISDDSDDSDAAFDPAAPDDP